MLKTFLPRSKVRNDIILIQLDFDSDKLFIVFSLLPNERKFSVLNFSIQRHADYTDPVKSKDRVVLISGFRKFIVQPIYSSFTKGGANNVHKFDRFLQNGRISVGTIYAPIQFGPAPIFMFKYSEDGMNWTDGNNLQKNLTLRKYHSIYRIRIGFRY